MLLPSGPVLFQTAVGVGGKGVRVGVDVLVGLGVFVGAGMLVGTGVEDEVTVGGSGVEVGATAGLQAVNTKVKRIASDLIMLDRWRMLILLCWPTA